MKLHKAILLGITAVLVLQVGPYTWARQGLAATGGVGSRSSRAAGFASLPMAARTAISAAIGRDDLSYHTRRFEDGFRTLTADGRLAAEFTRNGVRVEIDRARFCIVSEGFGRGEVLTLARVAPPQARVNRVEYRRGPLTEWYENGPLGLEQGFGLAEAPASVGRKAPLTIAFGFAGNLTPSLDPGGMSLTLTRSDGEAALRYTGLTAYDAAGRELPAWLELKGNRVLLRVDDARAHYPIVVDPFVQTAKLTASDGQTGDLFGASGGRLAVSGDTIVVGAQNATIGFNSKEGAAYVFVKTGRTWKSATEAAKLTASDGQAFDQFGVSVAISGNTVVVGAYQPTVGSKSGPGAVYVFVEPATGWASEPQETETAKLTASDGAANDLLGSPVAIAGNTVVAGARQAMVNGNYQQGAAYIFVEPANGWTSETESAKLTASDGAAFNFFGVVGISGNTIVAGANGATVNGNYQQGAAYVFVEPATGWASEPLETETAKLTASDGQALDEFGFAAAIGDEVVVGAPDATIGSNFQQGAAYLFIEPTTGWASETESAKFTVSDGKAGDRLGWSVGLSGKTAVVGAAFATVGSNSSQGAAYVFIKPKGAWISGTETQKLTASDGAANDLFGYAVGINGGIVAVGAPQATVSVSNTGAVYVYVK